ncbi:MAG: hypothetical protein LLG00_17185 [Planctomycetaceae bacterium]|nr:hypothetical protein [Planctomycetaceae bacterium]
MVGRSFWGGAAMERCRCERITASSPSQRDLVVCFGAWDTNASFTHLVEQISRPALGVGWCSGNKRAVGRPVAYGARAAHAFPACRRDNSLNQVREVVAGILAGVCPGPKAAASRSRTRHEATRDTLAKRAGVLNGIGALVLRGRSHHVVRASQSVA